MVLLKLVDKFEILNYKKLPDSMLINRVDSKYFFNFQLTNDLLECFKNDYYIVDYGNGLINNYLTTYYDSLDLQFYKMHHNKRNKRLKVRQRTYVNSKLNYFEIKYKFKSRTSKERNKIRIDETEQKIVEFENNYFNDDKHIDVSLITNFDRITLVDKNINERVTLDFNLKFQNSINKIHLSNLVILELKQSSINRNSIIYKTLKKKNIRKSNFSKYFVGINLLDNNIKGNNFKPIRLKLEKNKIGGICD